MSEFSINEAAAAEIQRIFLQSGCCDPVARMYERADVSHLFVEFKTELLKREKTTDDLHDMGKKRFEEVADQIESLLMVGAYERADFRPEDLCVIGGIWFIAGVRFAEMLRDCCLTFEEGRFLLRDADNKAQTLRSLAIRI
jgi:hypothetical protein